MDRLRFLFMGGAAALALAAPAAWAQSPSRGELLYGTHCGACHSMQMHWREKKLATSWETLLLQVRRWQGVAQLGWSEAEVEDVARYLNQTLYGYPEPSRVGLWTPRSMTAQP